MASSLSAVVDGLVSALEAAQTGTVYEPTLVQPVLFWPAADAVPDGVRTFYLVRVGERSGINLDSCHVTDRVEVFVLAATRYTSPSSDPFKEEPSRLSVSMDLEADVLLKLREDEKLGGAALDVFDAPPVTDHAAYDPAWVCPEIRLLVRYRYARAGR